MPKPELTSENEFLFPDLSKIVTEDDEPVDNVISERQQRLLWDCLDASWQPGRPYLALSNVGFFHDLEKDPVVPDFLLSLDVEVPGNLSEKKNRSYFLVTFGKPPDVVVEVVSNTEGGEDTRKLELYRRLHVSYYAIFDPESYLSKRPLRLFELRGTNYVEHLDPFQPLDLGLGFTLWEGGFGGYEATWLRWRDAEGQLLSTGKERADQEHQRADQEHQRADQEHQRAEQERQRADREHQRAEQEHQRAEKMATRLRELGEELD